MEFDEGLNKLETEAFERVTKYIIDEHELIDEIAIRVLAGYKWAQERSFDPRFIQKHFDNDTEYAKELLKHYQDSGKTLHDVINEIIKHQAAAISLRRIADGKPQSPDDFDNDRMEAKRYIAYLFFEDIRKGCFDNGLCPDFKVNILNDEIIHLLKSLTVDDYCKIKGYLQYIDRKAKFGQEIHGYDRLDYLSSMNYLDNVFTNCKKQKLKKLNDKIKKLIDDKELIKRAKYNTCYRLGCIDDETIEGFVEEYYSFISKVLSNQAEGNKAINLLKEIYNKSNSKVVNVMELLLKCMIISYVHEQEYEKIRLIAGKDKRKITKAIEKVISQEDPIFYLSAKTQ